VPEEEEREEQEPQVTFDHFHHPTNAKYKRTHEKLNAGQKLERRFCISVVLNGNLFLV
jgi:hypothetical protein